MKKVFFILLVLLSFCVTNAVAENLYTLRSEHFEFIYPAESEETAVILYENAENLYEKATSLLKTDINIFLPVYITPNTQQLNAYFTAAPYNRIVFYDTPADSFSLAVFSNTKVYIFYHELVHAITMNMKNGFWNFLSTLLGDVYSPSYLYSSSLSFLEGATVSFESMDGEGRLNNGDSLAYLVQAKIEDVFPSWKDASGPRDIFPKTQYAYLFGGAFNSYIQKKYGLEKYSELWNFCGSGGGWNPFIDGSFKKVYGVSLEEEWNAFAETIPVPALADDVEVFPVADKPSYHSAMAFRNGAEKGIAFLDNSSYIKYVPIDSDTGLPGKARKLLLGDKYISDMAFSEDGRYLLINGIGTNLANVYSLKIYDMEQDEYVAREVYPLSSACTADFDGYGKFVVGAAVRSGRAYLEIRDFNEVLEQGNNAAVLYSAKLPVLREVYSLCAAGGKIWSLEKESGVWNIAVYEFGAKENHCYLERKEVYPFPKGVVPSSFAYGGTSNGMYTFYCAVAGKGYTATENTPGALSRLLTVEIPMPQDSSCASAEPNAQEESSVEAVAAKARFSLAKGDVSGGVHRPFYDPSTDTLYFIARKAESLDVSYCHGIPGGLCELSPVYAVPAAQDANFTSSGQSSQNEELASDAQDFTQNTMGGLQDEELVLPAERGIYNPLRFIFPGTFIPAGLDLTTEEVYLLGATWVTFDPTESFKILVSGGWDYFNVKGGVSARVFGGPSFLSYELSLLSEWNRFGFDKIRSKGVLSGAVPVNTRFQEIQYGNSLEYEYQNSTHTFMNKFRIGYASEFKTGKGFFDKLSFMAGTTFITEGFFSNNSQFNLQNNIGLFLNAGTGGLFPISAQASVVGDAKTFLSLSGDVMLFSAEIQKGVPLLPFFANRFTLTAGYVADWQCSPRNMMMLDFPNLITNLSDMNVKHGIRCGANFTISPIMSLIYSFSFKVGANFAWYFGNEQDNKRYDLVVCGVFTF